MTLPGDDKDAACFTDFRHYSRRCLKIQTMEGVLSPFALNEPQLFLERIVMDIKEMGLPVRLVVLKARREGVSTWTEGRFYWHTSTKFNRYAVTVTHEPEATDFIFKMTKRFHANVPDKLRPATKYSNSKLLEFNTPDGLGLDSAFRVGTAEKEDFGSGQLVHFLHLCMAPDTPVLVEHGREKYVHQIVPGDKVVTHNGNVGIVTAVTKKTVDGDMIAIHPWLGYPVKLTPQHKVWTNMGWVLAGELNPEWHLVSMPIREITHNTKTLPVNGRKFGYGPKYDGPIEFPLNEDTGFAIGYYLAEGCVSRTKGGLGPYQRVSFTLHTSEDTFAKRACEALRPYCKSPAKIKTRKGTLTKIYAIDSGIIAAFIADNFGASDKKHIPDWVFNCGEAFCRGIIAGYTAGDGSKGIGGSRQNYESNSVVISSIRESLVYQVRDLVAALGYGWGSVKYKAGFVCSRGRNNKPQWTVSFNGHCGQAIRKIAGIPWAPLGRKADAGQRYRLDWNNRKVWLKIKKIERAHCDEVYDLSIDHADHSFRTPHFAVSNSEVCKWPKATQTALLTSLLQCVPDELDTEVVLESTAKGIGGEFYSRFNGARRKYDVRLKEGKPTLYKTINEDANAENSYCSVFLPWFVFDKYRKEPPENFVLTVEEEDIKRLYGLTDAHIYWRRWAIENRCNGDVDTFMQEYPSNPMECFLATGRPVFDMKKLLALKASLPKPKIRYELMFNHWTQSPEGRLKVWSEPLAGRAYIVAADVAEGLVKGDFSVADVIDHLTGEQVAHWHGHIDPDEFGRVLYWLGTKYNTALIVPERNNHGLTTVTTLNTMKYHRLYAEMVAEPPSKTRKRFGWATTTKTRPLIIDTLIALVREGFHGLRCAETVGEMMGFKIQDDGKMEADEGLHDDRVISYAIAQHIRKMNPAPRSSMSVAPSASRPGSINVSKMPSGAWT